MAKYPFTPDGVKAKVTELFRLSDEERTVQAEAVWRDLRSWLRESFTLVPAQDKYLAEMDDGFLSYIASNLGIAIQNKIDIKMDNTPIKDPWIAKWITVVVNFDLRYQPKAAISGDGQLVIMINYA
jgi:hypothetical protein